MQSTTDQDITRAGRGALGPYMPCGSACPTSSTTPNRSRAPESATTTKPDLIVEFERRQPGPTPDGGRSEVPWLLAHYDFVLQPTAQ